MTPRPMLLPPATVEAGTGTSVALANAICPFCMGARVVSDQRPRHAEPMLSYGGDRRALAVLHHPQAVEAPPYSRSAIRVRRGGSLVHRRLPIGRSLPTRTGAPRSLDDGLALITFTSAPPCPRAAVERLERSAHGVVPTAHAVHAPCLTRLLRAPLSPPRALFHRGVDFIPYSIASCAWEQRGRVSASSGRALGFANHGSFFDTPVRRPQRSARDRSPPRAGARQARAQCFGPQRQVRLNRYLHVYLPFVAPSLIRTSGQQQVTERIDGRQAPHPQPAPCASCCRRRTTRYRSCSVSTVCSMSGGDLRYPPSERPPHSAP
ncbi:hypothetical protein BC628DRAFT_376355 [Trametes gibbosa]|nr:hypothetical protein BC628DRAFT_376355 [Trametes gibbosa]